MHLGEVTGDGSGITLGSVNPLLATIWPPSGPFGALSQGYTLLFLLFIFF